MLSVDAVIKVAAVRGRFARGQVCTLLRDWVRTAHFQLVIPLTNVSRPCGTFTIANLALGLKHTI